jgi:replication fork protection complex subunit Csm3/Swi3
MHVDSKRPSVKPYSGLNLQRVFRDALRRHRRNPPIQCHIVNMPSAVSPNPRAGSPAHDDIDNLFNYDDAVDDFLKDLPLDKANANSSNNTSTAQEPAKNIDEEITVKKKRKPNPKLDEPLLLSEKGLPKLRKITKSRLKLKGKGHEYSDMSMLLDTYQLWLDELYPKAKFRDALSMVEKLGHSKAMQVRRRAWLDETKPTARERTPEVTDDAVMSGALPMEEEHQDTAAVAGDRTTAYVTTRTQNTSTLRNGSLLQDAPEDDELDALIAETGAPSEPHPRQQQKRKAPFEEDDDEDDLDALLAEQSTIQGSSIAAALPQQSNHASRNESTLDDFADEEEAMAGMDW